MRVRFEGQSHCPGKAKVRNFDLACVRVHQQVARLQVAVHDASLVAVLGPFEQLVEDRFALHGSHRGPLFVQKFLHVQVEVLKDQEQTIVLQPVHDFDQINDVWVVAELL